MKDRFIYFTKEVASMFNLRDDEARVLAKMIKVQTMSGHYYFTNKDLEKIQVLLTVINNL